MRRTEDISILLTDETFRKILSEWRDLDEAGKEKILREYELGSGDMAVLRQLSMSLDFRRFEHPETVVKEALNRTIWKIAERKMIPAEKPGRQFFKVFSRIAAMLLIPMAIYLGYVQFYQTRTAGPLATQRSITVNSQPGTVTKLTLPDGSLVWLNSGSSVSYPDAFCGKTRNVSLTGEAYFDVVKNKQMPMIVSAGSTLVKVYGTTFNVNASYSESCVKVTLVEGSVSLSSREGKLNGKEEYFLQPGETATLRRDSKELTVQKEDPFTQTAWKDGILLFRNCPFSTILERLSRKFNVDIELKDRALGTIPMDAGFRDENLHEILRLLSSGTPFSYYYEKPRKLSDGTFARSKIYIENCE